MKWIRQWHKSLPDDFGNNQRGLGTSIYPRGSGHSLSIWCRLRWWISAVGRSKMLLTLENLLLMVKKRIVFLRSSSRLPIVKFLMKGFSGYRFRHHTAGNFRLLTTNQVNRVQSRVWLNKYHCPTPKEAMTRHWPCRLKSKDYLISKWVLHSFYVVHTK